MTTTALITGATSGIGRAAADKLAQSGVHVMVVGRNVERGEKTIAEIRAAGGKADFISSDLRDAASARAVARKAVELGGGHVDILINNAGIFPFGPTHEMSEESFDDVYALNVKASYFLVAELAPLMAQRGKGAIVNVSTMVADYGAAGLSLYGSSKAAINLLDRPAPKARRQWATRCNSSRRKRRPGVRPRLRRLPRRSCSWRPTAPVLCRARFCRSMAAEPPYRFRRARGISVGAASTDGDDIDPERPIAVACAPRALPRPAGHGRMIMRHALVRKPLAHRVDRRATPARRVHIASIAELLGMAAIEG